MMEKGICKLCLQEKLLCNKSHVLPKHSYKILKDDGYCLYIDQETANKESKQKDYSGVFESNILCENCEQNILSNYEKYGYILIYCNNLKNISKVMSDDKIIINGSGYNYLKIKLYFLSILWKSSISSNKFFEEVKLSNDVEDRIRSMLLNNDPGEEKDFPIFISAPHLSNGAKFDSRDILITRSPIKRQVKKIDIYDFLVTGQNICFIIDDRGASEHINSIQKDTFLIFVKSKERSIKYRESNQNAIFKLFEK
jgi:hypothetical protein